MNLKLCAVFFINFNVLLTHLVVGLFEQCNHVINLSAGEKVYVNSPYYPGRYPVGTSCRYVINAPDDYQLNFQCNVDLSVPFGATRCINEIFYFNREGSELLSGSEFFCGSGTMERKSFLNRAVISYISSSTTMRNVLATAGEATDMRDGPTTTSTSTTTTTTTTSRPSTLGNFSPFLYALLPSFNQITSSNKNNNKKFEQLNTFVQPANTKPTVGVDVGAIANPLAYLEAVLATTTTTTARPLGPPNLPILTIVNNVFPAITWRNGSAEVDTNVPLNVSSNQTLANSTSSKEIKRQSRIIVNQNSGVPAPAMSGVFGNFITGIATNIVNPVTNPTTGGRFSCLVEVVSSDCECGWSRTTKVAGESSEAAINEFPSMAGVRTVRTQKIFCGAAIIHHRYLLSAAHCFASAQTNRSSLIRVVVGEHDFSVSTESLYTRTYAVQAIIRHEDFRTVKSKVYNDIALLRTSISMTYNRGVGPACLPFLSVNGTTNGRRIPIPGQRVIAAGWGTTSFGGLQSTRLLKTTLDVITKKRCKASLTSLPHSIFCTYTPGRDTCQYDSGGALYLRNEYLYAVGIVSYGFACATQQPSVNTKVALYLSWIKSKTPEVTYCVK